MINVAQITWSEEGLPYSEQFEDIYFSRSGGVAECEAVFLAGNGLPEAWQGKTLFTIGETGFGSGINFLTTCHHFSQTTTTETLRFISVEKYPLSSTDFIKIHQQLPTHLHPWASELQQKMPPLLAGWHYLQISERIELWLYFGDAVTGFLDLNRNIAINAWYLDGFSPAKNPQMWSQGLFFQLSRLSAPLARLSTFTAAGAVRKGLSLAGFGVSKVAGFGGKRERIIAVHQQMNKFQRSYHKSYLPLPAHALPIGSRVAIIGAGISGATIASQLAQAGIQVTVYEQQTKPASEASGNLAGIVMPVLDRQQGFYAQWYWQACLSAVRWLSQQEDETLGQVSGVFTWQSHPQRQQELKDWVNHLHAPSWLRHLATTDTVSVLGESLPAGILVTQAGWMSPPKVVAKLLDHPNIRLCCATRVTTLKEQATDGWTIHLQDSHGVSEEDYDAIVVACGTGVDQLLPEWTEHLPKQKGQVVHLPMQTWQGQVPTMPWMFDGYAMPPVAGQICIGATFEKATPLGVTSAGIADNLQCLADAISQHRYLPTSRLTGHSAYRLMTKDHLPLVGGLVKVDSYQTGIAQCVHRPDTCKEMSYSLRSNLYVSIGHGSRGLTSAFLAAEVIRSQILGQISPVGLRLLQAVHPARTFFRQMHTVKE